MDAGIVLLQHYRMKSSLGRKGERERPFSSFFWSEISIVLYQTNTNANTSSIGKDRDPREVVFYFIF